jgi:hypothetical protein
VLDSPQVHAYLPFRGKRTFKNPYLYASEEGIRAMAQPARSRCSRPARSTSLRETRLPPIQAFRDAGVAMAATEQPGQLADDLAAADAQHSLHSVPVDAGGGGGRVTRHAASRSAWPARTALWRWARPPISPSGTSTIGRARLPHRRQPLRRRGPRRGRPARGFTLRFRSG